MTLKEFRQRVKLDGIWLRIETPENMEGSRSFHRSVRGELTLDNLRRAEKELIADMARRGVFVRLEGKNDRQKE